MSKIVWLGLALALALICYANAKAQENWPVKSLDRVASPQKRKLIRPDDAAELVFQVRQVVRLDGLSAGTKRVRMWVSIPSDGTNQTLLNFKVGSVPGDWTIVDDRDHRGRFIALDLRNPSSEFIEVECDFEIRRQRTFFDVDPDRVGVLTEGLKALLAEHRVLDAPHMTVDESTQKMADGICGDETNIYLQATMIIDHVAKTVDHYSYSKDARMPQCGIGDAATCKAQGGGCCTDLNSLFISLARARGIPTRLQMGYRLLEEKANSLAESGYRCWVEYFVPNYGWVPSDIVEADRPGGLGLERWYSGLTARRVWLNQGREFMFADDHVEGRINHMSIGYAEIDDKPARIIPDESGPSQITRKIYFSEGSDVKSSKAEQGAR